MFQRFSTLVSDKAGNAITFCGACFVVAVWALSGPFFHFSDTWQLVINTGTTIITFLMVFLIQNSQNRDIRAIMLKLDALISASAASNAFMHIESADTDTLDRLDAALQRRRDALRQ